MKRIQFLYRCRVCNETFGGAMTGEEYGIHNIMEALGTDRAELPRFEFHECPYGGRQGVGDLIGYKPADPEPEGPVPPPPPPPPERRGPEPVDIREAHPQEPA